jgi:hypothetical protein
METIILIIVLVIGIVHLFAINEVAGSIGKGVYHWSKGYDDIEED